MVIEKINITPNANFTQLGGTTVHDRTDKPYIEYREKWIENPRHFILNKVPIHLDIEATSRCNLKCTFCDKLPYLSSKDFGDIDFGLFRKIIDEGCEKGLCSIKLSYRGEPLLHNQLPEMVKYARNKRILDIYFNTNGMLLTESKSQALIDAGLNRISISVEGTDPEAFETARVGAKFEIIKRNAGMLLDLREKSGSLYPKVRFQTVALPEIDLQEYASYWNDYCDETAAIDYKEACDRDENIIHPNWACPQLWQRMTIEWDGTIIPCNNDDYRNLSPGNIKEKTLEKCWNSKIVNDARTLHKNGRSHEVRACNGCPWRTTQLNKIING